VKIAKIRLILLCAVVLGGICATAQDLKLKPGAVKGEVMSFTKARNYGFCEFYLGSGPVAPNTELE